jgi:hypothetical protein
MQIKIDSAGVERALQMLVDKYPGRRCDVWCRHEKVWGQSDWGMVYTAITHGNDAGDTKASSNHITPELAAADLMASFDPIKSNAERVAKLRREVDELEKQIIFAGKSPE